MGPNIKKIHMQVALLMFALLLPNSYMLPMLETHGLSTAQ